MLGMRLNSSDSRRQRSYRNMEYEWMFTAFPQLPLESVSQDATAASTIDEIDDSNSSSHSDLMFISFVPPVPPASIIANSACTEYATAPAILHSSDRASNSNRKSKRVRFAEPEINSIYFHHSDVDDLRNSWYQENDYLYFESDNRLTILALRHARGDLRKLDPRRYTVSGLEKILTRRQMVGRKLQTARHVQTVVDAQRHPGQDEEQLKAISEMLSKQAMQRAHLRAALDQTLL